MTGFASLTHEDERATIAVTVRAVNHRFLDLQLRLPQSFGEWNRGSGRCSRSAWRAGASRSASPSRYGTAATPSVELNEDFANALIAASIRPQRGLVSGR
jgi:uncharacterized protein YicC (UPF0701 family)